MLLRVGCESATAVWSGQCFGLEDPVERSTRAFAEVQQSRLVLGRWRAACNPQAAQNHVGHPADDVAEDYSPYRPAHHPHSQCGQESTKNAYANEGAKGCDRFHTQIVASKA